MELPPLPKDDVIRVLGIDPGTLTFGTALIDVNINTYQMEVVYGNTLKLGTTVRDDDYMSSICGGRDGRMQELSSKLMSLLMDSAPTLVAAESPFLRLARVTTFEALVECFSVIRKTVWRYSPSMCVRRFDPIMVKNYCGISHIGTDKDDVRREVLSIFSANNINVDQFDEHTIDAIAVAYSHIQLHIHGIEAIRPPSAKSKLKAAGAKRVKRKRKRRRKK